jgi:hypothetical protein
MEYSMNPGIFYFPFSELLNDDEFILHSSHLNEGESSPIFVRINKNSYKNVATLEEFQHSDSESHRLMVALAPSDNEFAFIGESDDENQ